MSITKATACSHDNANYYLKNQSSKTSSSPILRCTEEIDLGVVFDTKLSLRNHINMSINKANRLLGIIRRSFCALDNTSCTLIYKAIVRPHLEYAATIWNPYKKGYIDDLEKVQRRATKLLQNEVLLSTFFQKATFQQQGDITSSCLYNIRKWFFSICIVDIWNSLPSNVVNASNVMCFEKRLDKCWADLKIQFDHEDPLNYSV